MSFNNKNWRSYITTAVFSILIFGFTVSTLIKPAVSFSETENRVLEQRPDIKAETIMNGEFETDYEQYLTDQFILRDKWIGLKTSVEKLLLKRESKDIYLAEAGYLIEKHTGTFGTDRAKQNVTSLIQFVKEYRGLFGDGHLTVMLVPNAVDILKDKLPPFAPSGDGEDYLRQVAVQLPEEVWFDASSVLHHHAEENIFYRTDHHWKTLGAFYVYQAWAKQQGYKSPELADYKIQTVTNCFEGTIQSKLGIKTARDTIELFNPVKKNCYTVQIDNGKNKKDSLYDYSALETKDKYAVYFGGNQALINIHTDTNNGRKILVIKDSYANCFIPFMLEEFEEITILDIRYSRQRVSEQITEGKYTDLLVLYNASGFAEDAEIAKLTN